jgi:hypothetical protein
VSSSPATTNLFHCSSIAEYINSLADARFYREVSQKITLKLRLSNKYKGFSDKSRKKSKERQLLGQIT